MAIFQVNVVGESFHQRQSIIAQTRSGMPVVLKREKDNPYGQSAVKVLVAEYAIGYIGKEDRWVAELIDNSVPISAHVWKVIGEGKKYRGVILEIAKEDDAEDGDFVCQGSYYDDDEERKPSYVYIFVILAVVIGALIGFFA